MSMTFTKLFSSITESTIWREDDHTRLVWITMLAMADSSGCVWASIPGLADRARVSIESCEFALGILMAPDKYSRTKAHEGRRIAEIDGGWQLINHAKYRAERDQTQRREYWREFKRKERERDAGVVHSVDMVDSVECPKAFRQSLIQFSTSS